MSLSSLITHCYSSPRSTTRWSSYTRVRSPLVSGEHWLIEPLLVVLQVGAEALNLLVEYCHDDLGQHLRMVLSQLNNSFMPDTIVPFVWPTVHPAIRKVVPRGIPWQSETFGLQYGPRVSFSNACLYYTTGF